MLDPLADTSARRPRFIRAFAKESKQFGARPQVGALLLSAWHLGVRLGRADAGARILR
jgi:hypothetical protein